MKKEMLSYNNNLSWLFLVYVHVQVLASGSVIVSVLYYMLGLNEIGGNTLVLFLHKYLYSSVS